MVFFGNQSGNAFALDARSGDEIWRFEATSGIRANVAVDADSVYAVDLNGILFRIAIDTGREIWRVATDQQADTSFRDLRSGPAVRSGLVVVGAGDGAVVAFHITDGSEAWRFETGAAVRSNPVINRGEVLVGSLDGYFYALDLSDGAQVWRADLGGGVESSPEVAGSRVFVGARDDALHALDRDTGRPIWRFETADWVGSSPTIDDGVVYVGGIDRRVYAVSADTGTARWNSRRMATSRRRPSFMTELFMSEQDPRTGGCMHSR